MKMDRRKFLIGCGAGAAYLATSKLSFATTSLGWSPDAEVNDILITVFLRGGCDGLNFLGPTSSSIYNDMRGSGIKVKAGGGSKGFEIKNGYKEEQFHLHYNAPELFDLYQNKDLAFIHACGLTNGTRSHFVAQDLIERGLVQNHSTNTGWMARYLGKQSSDAIIHGASLGGKMAESLFGYRNTASISKLDEFELAEGINDHRLFREWYGNASDLDKTAQQTLESIEYVRDNIHKYKPDAVYPSGSKYEELNNSFQNLAALMKMGAGIKAANIDFDGWDHHEGQGMSFPGLVQTLSRSLNAFYQDVAAFRNRITIVVMSEFGRRLKSNGSFGTDHGYGGLMMVLGGSVNGGKMYGSWPGLEKEQLNRGVDLEVTTDYRAVLAEIISQSQDGNAIFPGLGEHKKLGIVNRK